MSKTIKRLIYFRVSAEKAYGEIKDFHSQKQKEPFNEVYQGFLKYRARLRSLEVKGRELKELGRITKEISRLVTIISDESMKGQMIVT